MDDPIRRVLDHYGRDSQRKPAAEAGTRPSPTWPEPQPLPSDLPPVAKFDPRLLPEALRPWITDISERVQCPPDFPAVSAMVALAGIVGRKVGIRPKHRDDWLVVPNLWGAVIGRPGIMKTVAIQEPLRPLRRLEIAAAERYEQQVREFAAGKLVAEQRRKVKEAEIKKAIKDKQDANTIAHELLAEEAKPPIRRRHIVNDSTVEKLGEILNENPQGVVVYRDELTGLLRSLDKQGQEGARAFYLEAWNGNGRYTYDRIGRGTIDIVAAVVSLIGGIQPGPLGEYLRGAAKSGTGDDGLIQRFQLAVWPNVSRRWTNVDQWPDAQARERAYRVFAHLDTLDPMSLGAERDENDPEGIPFLRFSDEAQDSFNSWRADLEETVRSGGEHPAMESQLAKYRGLIPSLALLIHLADGREGPVGLDALNRAIGWGVYLESHARRIYATAINFEAAAAIALAKHLLKRNLPDGFALRDVYRRQWSGLATREDAARGVELLVDLDWLRETKEPTAGAPRTRYWINPRVYTMCQLPTDKTDKSRPGQLLSVLSAPSGGVAEDSIRRESEPAGADVGELVGEDLPF